MIARLVLLSIAMTALETATGQTGDWVPAKIMGMEYPLLAAQARLEGKVELLVSLDDQGLVRGVSTLSGSSVLAKAAKTNVMLWRMRP